jgi:hypothetical protein
VPGGLDKHPRFVSVRATPEGNVHWEREPIAVDLTVRVTRPVMDMRVEGWALAWTRNAVFCFWFERTADGQRPQSGWLPPVDVTRKR